MSTRPTNPAADDAAWVAWHERWCPFVIDGDKHPCGGDHPWPERLYPETPRPQPIQSRFIGRTCREVYLSETAAQAPSACGACGCAQTEHGDLSSGDLALGGPMACRNVTCKCAAFRLSRTPAPPAGRDGRYPSWEKYRAAIIDAGLAMGLIMPERAERFDEFIATAKRIVAERDAARAETQACRREKMHAEADRGMLKRSLSAAEGEVERLRFRIEYAAQMGADFRELRDYLRASLVAAAAPEAEDETTPAPERPEAGERCGHKWACWECSLPKGHDFGHAAADGTTWSFSDGPIRPAPAPTEPGPECGFIGSAQPKPGPGPSVGDKCERCQFKPEHTNYLPCPRCRRLTVPPKPEPSPFPRAAALARARKYYKQARNDNPPMVDGTDSWAAKVEASMRAILDALEAEK